MTVRTFFAHATGWRRGEETLTPGASPGTPPPPSGGAHRPASTIFGSSAGVPASANTPTELDAYRGLSKLDLFDLWQAEFAGKAGLTHSNAAPLMKAFHNYDATIPSSIASSAVNGIVERNLVGAMGCKSTKGQVAAGAHDAAIQALCASYTGTKTLYLGNNHEPGNDSDWNATTAQLWRNDQAHWAKKIIEYRGPKPIVPFVCVINWDISPKNKAAANGPAAWQNPAAEMLAAGVALDEVVYTVDGYDTSPTSVGGAETLYIPTKNVASGWGFSRFGVSEGACKSYATANPNDRGLADDWIREAADVCATYDFEYFLWFASGVGNRAGAEGWWLYGDANKAQWAQVCAGVYP